jgi:predicted alpha/beta hydrolase family esterase
MEVFLFGMIDDMKTAFLLHGTGGSDTEYFWFKDTKEYLESRGYSVWWPLLPNTEKPDLTDSLDFLKANAPACDDQSIIIGHSSACPLILSFLQELGAPIKQAILVAGYYEKFEEGNIANLMLEANYDWERIKRNSPEILFLNSDNDPWGCSDIKAKDAATSLQAPLIVMSGQGHMGSLTYHQTYEKFDLLKRLIKSS